MPRYARNICREAVPRLAPPFFLGRTYPDCAAENGVRDERAKVVTALQLLAMDVDWDEDEDVVLRILRTLRRAYPEATREQLIIAIKRAQTEIDLRITAVNGWHLDYDITDKRWEKLERIKVRRLPPYRSA